MNKRNISAGLILIVIALVLLLGKVGVIGWIGSVFWPVLALLLPGIILHLLYFNKILPSGVLVPGGILITYSLLFLITNLFGYQTLQVLWPAFIFGFAVGIYELYYFEPNADKGLFRIAIILALASAALLIVTLLFSLSIYLIVFLLLIAGVALLLWKPKAW